MSLPTLKKREVVVENGQFTSDWTEKYAFIETAGGVCFAKNILQRNFSM